MHVNGGLYSIDWDVGGGVQIILDGLMLLCKSKSKIKEYFILI